MSSPSTVRVKIDGQGRMVIPARLRDEITTTPGEVIVKQTPEGLLLMAASHEGSVDNGDDGLPVLLLDRAVTNDDVLSAVDDERMRR
jgi:bifunctional DNA-binding transcriptional regulator/antitoxin component of YhaV-PrlF toxin-antitoxin module